MKENNTTTEGIQLDLFPVKKDKAIIKNIDYVDISELPDDVDLLVNIAGIFPYGPVIESSLDQYDNCMNVNMKLPYLLSQGLFNKIP